MSRWGLTFKGVEVVSPEEWNLIVTALDELDGRTPLEKNGGVASIPNGQSTVTIQHGLTATPTIILLTGTHSEVSSLWVTGVTATEFTINTASPVTADRSVYWLAIRL
jgi:hypothetical protein